MPAAMPNFVTSDVFAETLALVIQEYEGKIAALEARIAMLEGRTAPAELLDRIAGAAGIEISRRVERRRYIRRGILRHRSRLDVGRAANDARSAARQWLATRRPK
jgi:hypothetical protein